MKNTEVAKSALPGDGYGAAEAELVSRAPISAFVLILLALAAVATAYLLFAASPPVPATPASHVRIRNDTRYPFQQVVVNGRSYGTIEPGKMSDYLDLGVTYRYAQVRLVAAGRELSMQPDDYVGEQPLGKGSFTYALKIVDLDSPGGLTISVEPDPLKSR